MTRNSSATHVQQESKPSTSQCTMLRNVLEIGWDDPMDKCPAKQEKRVVASIWRMDGSLCHARNLSSSPKAVLEVRSVPCQRVSRIRDEGQRLQALNPGGRKGRVGSDSGRSTHLESQEAGVVVVRWMAAVVVEELKAEGEGERAEFWNDKTPKQRTCLDSR